MHFVSDPRKAEGRAPRPDEESRAARDEARQAAVAYLEAAATTEDEATRNSLRRRAAELLSAPRRDQIR
jgi:hypothetical protein